MWAFSLLFLLVACGGPVVSPGGASDCRPDRPDDCDELPGITDVRPADGETGVALDAGVATDLQLPFAGVDDSTLSSDTVRLIDLSTGAQVDARVGTTGGYDAITAQPRSKLKPLTEYRFEVTSGVKDQKGFSFTPFHSNFKTGQAQVEEPNEVAFDKVALPTADGSGYTSLTIGPDGYLYAAVETGEIKRFEILADGRLGKPQTITTVPENEGGPRLLIGLTFDPSATADNLIMWVSHTQLSFQEANDWTGKISKLTGPNLQTLQDVVINLPRSEIDHVTNSIAFNHTDPNDPAMYVVQGSNSAMGAADTTWGMRPERLLSGAVLRVDPTLITNPPLDVKTEDGGNYDPFAPGAPVTVYGSGVRNAYDLVWHSNGELYVPTNGSASGGKTPKTPDPLPDSCQTRLDDDENGDYTGPKVSGIDRVSKSQNDYLFRVEEGGYYGHPNPLRCEWVLNGGNPNSWADPAEVDDYPVGTEPDRNWRGFAYNFGKNKSANGAIEYRSNVFGDELRGKLLVVRFSLGDDIIVLTPGGADLDIVEDEMGIEGFQGFNDPLDLTENPASGDIYVSEYVRPNNQGERGGIPTITLLRPRVQ